MIDPADIAPERMRPLRRTEYDRLVEAGVFENERIELLYGQLVERNPQLAPHAEATRRLTAILVPALSGRAVVQIQSPFAASDDSEPEPDVAVLPLGDYSRDHPSRAYLVIEVAYTSRAKDLNVKTRLYAQSDVQEYWVVDIRERCVIVAQRAVGGAFTKISRHGERATVRLAAFRDVAMRVRDILPTR